MTTASVTVPWRCDLSWCRAVRRRDWSTELARVATRSRLQRCIKHTYAYVLLLSSSLRRFLCSAILQNHRCRLEQEQTGYNNGRFGRDASIASSDGGYQIRGSAWMKKNVIKTMILVCLSFLICWFPLKPTTWPWPSHEYNNITTDLFYMRACLCLQNQHADEPDHVRRRDRKPDSPRDGSRYEH